MAAAGRVHVNPVNKLLDMNVAIADIHAVVETRPLCCRSFMLLMRRCMIYVAHVYDLRLLVCIMCVC
jgi:hypothetical protein